MDTLYRAHNLGQLYTPKTQQRLARAAKVFDASAHHQEKKQSFKVAEGENASSVPKRANAGRSARLVLEAFGPPSSR